MKRSSDDYRALGPPSLLIGIAVIVQIIGRYYSAPFLLWNHFDLLKFVLIFLFPLSVSLWVMGFKPKDLGLRLPQFPSKQFFLILVFVLALIPLIISAVLWSGEYLNYYKQYTQSPTSLEAKWIRFSLFTASTLIGWEFLHRSFLLFGIKYCLEKYKVPALHAAYLSALIVMGFEVIYHFVKPDMEAWGMLIFSPILSYLAIRTKSFWTAYGVHLYVEIIFILTLTLGAPSN